MNSYFSPGHKTSRNWSKPRKLCAFLFNLKIVYTARWRLFATPDQLEYIYLLTSSNSALLKKEALDNRF